MAISIMISDNFLMTNYEKLFQERMKDPQFAKAYNEARIERMINDFWENLKEKISNNEPKEVLLETIDSMQRQIIF
jgi:hypothetical protein